MDGQTGHPKSLRSFFYIFTGQIFSLFGSDLVQFALIWYLTRETGSAIVLGFATVMGTLPQIFISPIAGALIDRWDRKRVMIIADSAVAFLTLILAFLFFMGWQQFWHVYVLMFLRSAFGSFQWAAMQASIPMIVPEKHLTRTAGLNQTLYGVIRIVSPPAGALFLEIMPLQSILMIDVVTAFFAVMLLFFIHIPGPVRTIAAETKDTVKRIWLDIREGFNFVWKWKGLKIIFIMSLFINLLYIPVYSFQPLLVTEHFGGGAIELGWMQSAWGVGSIAGGLLLSLWGGTKNRVITALASLILRGAALIFIGLLSPAHFQLAIILFFVIGLANPLIDGTLFATMQVTVPNQLQGRVFTLLNSFSSATIPVGLLIASPIAEFTGVPVWFLISGIIVIIIGVGAFFLPDLINIQKDRERFRSQIKDTIQG